MPTHTEVIEALCRQRDEARALARQLHWEYQHLRAVYALACGADSRTVRWLYEEADALAQQYPWLETEQAAALPARLPFVQPAEEE